MKTNTNYSFKHEGKLLEQDLKAMIKKIKADTKDLKKRVKAYTKRVNKFYDINAESHTDLAHQVYSYGARVSEIVYYEAGIIFDDWKDCD